MRRIFLVTVLFSASSAFSMQNSCPSQKYWEEAEAWLDRFNSEEAEIERVHTSLEKLAALPYSDDVYVQKFMQQLKRREAYLLGLIQGSKIKPPHYNPRVQGIMLGHADPFIEGQKIIESDMQEWVKDETREVDFELFLLKDSHAEQVNNLIVRLIADKAVLNLILCNPTIAPVTKQIPLFEALEESRKLRETSHNFRKRQELEEHTSLARAANTPKFAQKTLHELLDLLRRVERFNYEPQYPEIKRSLEQAIKDLTGVINKQYSLSYDASRDIALLLHASSMWLKEKGTHYLSPEAESRNTMPLFY